MRVAVAILFIFWVIEETHTAVLIIWAWLQEVREKSTNRKTEAKIAAREEELLESYMV